MDITIITVENIISLKAFSLTNRSILKTEKIVPIRKNNPKSTMALIPKVVFGIYIINEIFINISNFKIK